ncbi:MAG TPA: zinc-dependent alcohol dehydrogenase family protein [Chloroflexi bacterium]|jgi:2-desacetyl-2-hydroxyethyl bacteriochlorophyllide A dehydrogenase|nr:zinc-dependent alcohol dehydrogenase family protein [Chloroflexota bacterium]
MKAAVFYGRSDLRIEEREDPHPEPGEVLIRVAACGICGTDRHIYHGEFDTTPPVIIGHEYAGEIVALGEGVTDLAVGDRVAVDPNMACGVCRSCRRGEIHLCENLTALGVDVDGGFAELCRVPRSQCYRLPASVSAPEGAMVEPLACCVHGIDLAEIQAGDTVAVIGGGAIGQMLAQLARLRGAGRLVLSDPLAARREMALSLGVDIVVDPMNEDPLAPGGALEGGADVVIEAVGSVHTNAQALTWAARGGTVLWFGVTPPGQTVAVEPNLLFQKELTIRGALVNPYTHARALALLGSGQVRVEPLITRTIGLDELPDVLDQPPGDDIKTVVVP